MMASFHLMRRQLSARLRWLTCGQVGERGSCPLIEVTHVLRPAESASYYSRKKVVPKTAVVTARVHATVLKTCVLSRMGKGRFGPAFRSVPYSRGRFARRVSLAFRTGSRCVACW